MKRLYDLTVVAGTYEKNGETKRRYQQIGTMMESDDGKPFILLDPLINFAAVPRQEGRDRVMVSCFEPKDEDKQTRGSNKADKPIYGDDQYKAVMKANAPLDDDVPF